MHFELSSFISIVGSLFFLEVLLSVDNALVNASLAEGLPPAQRNSALRSGIIYGAVFRIIALIFASIIIHNFWIKTAGALYLIFLAVQHLGKETDEVKKRHKAIATYKGVVIEIAIANIVFGIDNVVSAVGLSSNLVYIITGVLIGIAAILLISQLMLKVIEKYPSLVSAAYVIVGSVGGLIVLEEYLGREIPAMYKFALIVGIIVFTICYEHSLILQKILKPVFKKIQLVLGLPADAYQMIARGRNL